MIRIINNQSFPHPGPDPPDLEGDTPVAFNAGIRAEDFPTKQITSKHLLRRLTLVGMGARAAKVDMENAYKVTDHWSLILALLVHTVYIVAYSREAGGCDPPVHPGVS